MLHNRLTHAHIVRAQDDRFDTENIVKTVHRFRQEAAMLDDGTELLDLMVLGRVETEPTKLRVIGKVLYKATNRVVAVPYEVDAGALRGLEAGVAAD